MVVLGSTAEPWGTNDRNGVATEPSRELSSRNSIWTLCSLMSQQVPDARSQLLYKIIHIEARVLHAGLGLSGEMAFKITEESISELIECHWAHLVNACNGWSEETKGLQNKFIKSVKEFIYWTSNTALLDLTFGPNEFSNGRSDKAKTAIMNLFQSPPPPSNITSTVKTIQHFPSPTIWNAPSWPQSSGGVSSDISGILETGGLLSTSSLLDIGGLLGSSGGVSADISGILETSGLLSTSSLLDTGGLLGFSDGVSSDIGGILETSGFVGSSGLLGRCGLAG
ncbi:MAG: hypothetical protein M1840_000629 [Geoglossum simile]|nr:MAG: hypothetical protein M1840_000629 [Geoglossum simile]